MASTDEAVGAALDSLQGRLEGALLRPGDDGYDAARTVWNGRIDREPVAVARCASRSDVEAVVSATRGLDLPLSPKGGGHHVSGSAVPDGGLLLDLSPLSAVEVDPAARTVRVEAGATWGAVDEACRAHGLVVPGSQAPSVGVAGLTLGGGTGWLSPQFGLTSDNLIAAEVVTADGESVRTSADEHPDLFWALRGGGGGFCVVTAFEFRCHEFADSVLAGSLVYRPEDAPAVIRNYESYIEDAPRTVRPLLGFMELPDAPYYPETAHGERVLLVICCHAGDPEAGEAALEPLRSFGDPLMDSVRERSYLAWQQVGESATVERTAVRSRFLESLEPGAVETILDWGLDVPSSAATVFVSTHRGAETDPSVGATAYPHRTTAPHVLLETRWSDPARDGANLDWVRSASRALEPYATGAAAVNFLSDEELPDRLPTVYGENWERLVGVLETWDPNHRFHPSPDGR